MGDLKLYMTSVSSSSEVKGKQNKIQMILESKKISFEKVDISQGGDAKDEMRSIAQDSSCLPPQLARGNVYLGDYDKFMEAVEDEILEEFLKVKEQSS